MNRVIVTDIRYRMSLAVIRSLGRKGIPVTAAENDTTPTDASLGFFSRYTYEKAWIYSASQDPGKFAEELIKLSGPGDAGKSSIEEKPVLIPVGLDSLMAAARFRSRLEPYVLFSVPTLESIETANDTQKLIDLAQSLDIPCPATTTLQENETIEALSQRIRYPVVVKYRKGELLKLKPEKRYKIIQTQEDFMRIFPEMHSIQDHPLVQQYVTGAGFGVSAVFDKKGEPLEIFCHQRLREYPVTGGPSCFCQSIWNDRLVDYSVRLLKALNWCGVAMVEFKGDMDGDIYLMEINPRFWGSMPLSVLAKCDIPYALYRSALGETVSTPNIAWYPSRYRLGKKMRFLFQDLLSFSGYLRRRKDKARFVAGYILDWLNPWNTDGVLEFRDWRPSLAYIRQAFRKAGRND